MTRLAAILLAPVALPQARRLQRDTPRLEPAAPRAGGSRAAGAMRLLVLGDSTAVGTGVERMTDALAGQLARRLGGPVAWRVVGENGLTSAEVRERCMTEALAAPHDLVVLLVGWNDALHLRSAGAFARDLGALLDALAAAEPSARRVVVLPPRFMDLAALPQPLRHALGAHVAGLTRAAIRVAREHGAAIAPGFDGEHVASDRFHPDAAGYARIAQGVVDALG